MSAQTNTHRLSTVKIKEKKRQRKQKRINKNENKIFAHFKHESIDPIGL